MTPTPEELEQLRAKLVEVLGQRNAETLMSLLDQARDVRQILAATYDLTWRLDRLARPRDVA